MRLDNERVAPVIRKRATAVQQRGITRIRRAVISSLLRQVAASDIQFQRYYSRVLQVLRAPHALLYTIIYMYKTYVRD